MNRTSLACIVLSALSCAFSCTRQEIDVPGGRRTVEIVFSSGSTRTVLDGKKVLWQSGDALSVWDGASNCRFTTAGGGESAVFTGEAEDVESYLVLYPYSVDNSFGADSVLTSIPTLQKAVSGSFDPEANTAYGTTVKGSGGKHSAQLKNVGAYLKFTVDSTWAGLSRATLRTRGGELISGPVSIPAGGVKGFDTEDVIFPAGTGKDYVSLAPDSGTFSPGTYFLVFRPTALSEGLSLILDYAGGKSSTLDFTLSSTVRNTVYAVRKKSGGKTFSIGAEGILDDVLPFGTSAEGMDCTVATAWNGWTDAASLKAMLLKSAAEGKTYFSNFKYYNYLQGDLAENSIGVPHFHSMDFYEATGNYLPRSETRPVRQNIINIVKSCWKRNRAVCFFSWHLESPYAVYSEFGQKMGCRYCYGSSVTENFPLNHRYMVNEILNNARVDTLGITCMGDWFDDRVQEVADMINEFVDEDGRPIPIIFRLWHEQEDTWAWWQYSNSVSLEDYKAFYRLTVSKFREKCPSAEILFGYGPDRYHTTSLNYLLSYPGDDYVDIMGYDDYWIGSPSKSDFGGDEDLCYRTALGKAKLVSSIAARHGKVAVIFETNNDEPGYISTYYSDFVQPMLKDPNVSLSVFQMWSSAFSNDEKLSAFNAFKSQENIIFDH